MENKRLFPSLLAIATVFFILILLIIQRTIPRQKWDGAINGTYFGQFWCIALLADILLLYLFLDKIKKA
ncbi:MAG TPA: hypothetical protein VFR70_03250 [Flavobacterium sp.]|nr:hypothetical protein [Flavobacterium sp.]